MKLNEIKKFAQDANEDLMKIGLEIHPKLFSFLTAEDFLYPKDLLDEELKQKYNTIWKTKYGQYLTRLEILLFEYICEVITDYSAMGINLGYLPDGEDFINYSYNIKSHLKTLSFIRYSAILNENGDVIIKPVLESVQLERLIPFWERSYTIKTNKYYGKITSQYTVLEYIKNNANIIKSSVNTQSIDYMKYMIKQEENLGYNIIEVQNDGKLDVVAYKNYIDNVMLHLSLKHILENNIPSGKYNFLASGTGELYNNEGGH